MAWHPGAAFEDCPRGITTARPRCPETTTSRTGPLAGFPKTAGPDWGHDREVPSGLHRQEALQTAGGVW